ncbi:hypothetical protein HFN68_25010 [Rhizobium laguerreae]|uniref:hypothetical protein n=1 Tax=Rhizobium laguerreae TaxID=1076926 RepID=UPI001C912A56|nr:hypothetical protein [Rhizobium laguerreae]MBY3536149.1 hypothetical protein [Rhizobium laguerreae]
MANFADHPVVLCAMTAVGVLTVCTGITFSWIVPTMVASTNNKLEAATRESQKLASEKAESDNRLITLRAELADMGKRLTASEQEKMQIVADKDKRIAELKNELFESSTVNLFISGSPYPVGFDKVRVGDPVAKIAESYPFQNDSESSVRVSFRVPSDVFYRLSFDFDTDQKDVVEAVSLSIGRLRGLGSNPLPELPDSWIETTLRRVLGEPKAEIGPDKQCLVWTMDDAAKSLVYYRKKDTDYMVSSTLSPGGCYLTQDQRKEFDAKKR